MAHTLELFEGERWTPPEEYGIPPLKDRQTLRKGDYAKLLFKVAEKRKDGISGEYLWVEVDRALAGGRYKGKIQNRPIFVRGISRGNVAEFGPENVSEIGWNNKVRITQLDDDIIIEPLTTSRRGRPPKQK